jgi:hypothetical protein
LLNNACPLHFIATRKLVGISKRLKIFAETAINTTFYMVEFEIKSSKYLAIFIASLHFLALLAILTLQVSVILQLILGGLVWVHFSVQKHQFTQQKQPRKLIYFEDSGWKLITRQATDVIEIQPSTVITTFLIVIHYRIVLGENTLHSIVCFKDALSPKDFKRLIVQLKITGLSNK